MKAGPEMPIVIFDVAGMLGSVEVDSTGTPTRLLPYSNVPELLAHLRRTATCGAIIDGGPPAAPVLPQLLKDAGIYNFFDPMLVPPASAVFSMVSANSIESQPRVFASTSCSRRTVAHADGFRVAPHRDLIEAVLEGQPLVYVSVQRPETEGTVDDLIRGLPIIPIHRPSIATNVVYAVAVRSAVETLDARYRTIHEHPADPQLGAPTLTDLYLVRDCLDDSATSREFVARAKRQVILNWQIEDGLALALDAQQDIKNFHPPLGLHGHTRLLAPSRTLLRDSEQAGFPFPEPTSLSSLAGDTIRSILTADLIADYLWCWTGKRPLPGTDHRVLSRRVDHPDNFLVAQKLKETLEAILRRNAELTLIEPGTQRYNVEGSIEGTIGNEVVILGAHFDSVAMDGDTAPGADDDASGVAAVLAIAAALKALSATPPRRGIRFLLFNAEEDLMVGSGRWAAKFKDGAVRAAAMIQLDMIGVPRKTPKGKIVYETHPPCPQDYVGELDCSIRRGSIELAELIDRVGSYVRSSLVVDCPLANGLTSDPMRDRSDHASFLTRNVCPACVVTENSFGTASNDDPDFKRRYHSVNDTEVDVEYVSAIARSVAAAVWIIANP